MAIEEGGGIMGADGEHSVRNNNVVILKKNIDSDNNYSYRYSHSSRTRGHVVISGLDLVKEWKCWESCLLW